MRVRKRPILMVGKGGLPPPFDSAAKRGQPARRMSASLLGLRRKRFVSRFVAAFRAKWEFQHAPARLDHPP